MKITRFGVSVDDELLKRFDRFVADRGFPTRSEAIKNLMLEAIAREEWTKGDEVAGSVTFSYDHHKPGVVEKLLQAQHDFGESIVCSQHAHLTHSECLETIVVRGKSKQIEEFLNRLRHIKGLNNVALTVAYSDVR